MRPWKTTRLVFFLLFVLLAGPASGTTHRKKRRKAVSPARSAQLRVGPVTHGSQQRNEIFWAVLGKPQLSPIPPRVTRQTATI